MGIASVLTIIRSKWMMLKTDSMITGKNMFSVLVGGWRAAYLSAADYARMEALIINQRRAGIFGQPGMIALNSGYRVGGLERVNVTSRSGRVYTRYRDTTTGRWATRAQIAAAGAVGAGAVTTSVMGRGLPRLVGVGTRLLDWGRRLLGLLGGPWGVAITAATLFLPPLINKLMGNTNASQENAEALANNTAAVNNLADQYNKEMKNGVTPATDPFTREQLISAVNLLGLIAQGQRDKGVTVTIKTPNGNRTITSYEEDESFELNLT